MKFGQIVCLDEIWVGMFLGRLGSKTRSQGQIIEKPCVDDRGCSFHLISLDIGQIVYFDKIWAEIVFGSSWVKK